jgi:hypothetical protein
MTKEQMIRLRSGSWLKRTGSPLGLLGPSIFEVGKVYRVLKVEDDYIYFTNNERSHRIDLFELIESKSNIPSWF